jgi:hypothetical protein
LDERATRYFPGVEGLINAVADAIAAVLRAVGFVGSARRRSGIREDLQLLRELEAFPQFAENSFAHTVLSGRIDDEIAKLAGVNFKVPRKFAWSSLIVWTIFWIPLGFVTYLLNREGFSWYSLLSGIPAGLLFLATAGALLPDAETPTEEQPVEDSDSHELQDGLGS